MHKRPTWINAVAALGALLVLVVLLSWFNRVSLTAWAIERVMAAQGLCPCQVEVISLGLSHGVLSVHRSALGSITRIEIDYRLRRDVGKLIERLRVEGAHLAVAWRDGKLAPVLVAQGGARNGSGGLPVARIEVVDSSVSLTLDSTVVVATLAGTLVRDPHLTANFDFAIQAPQAQLHSNLQARGLDNGAIESLFVITDGDVAVAAMAAQGVTGKLRAVLAAHGLTELDGKFSVQALNTPQQAWGAGIVSMAQSPAGGLSLALQFTPLRLALHSDAQTLTSGAPFTLEGLLDARVLPGLLPGLSIDSGKIEFSASGTTPSTSTDLRELFKSARLQAEVHADIVAVTRADSTHVAHISAQLACGLAAAALTCHSPQGLQLDGIALPTTMVAADSAVAGLSTVQLAATDGAPLISLSATDDAATLSVTSSVLLQSPTRVVHGPLAAVISLDGVSPVAQPQPRQGRFGIRGKLSFEGSPKQETITPEIELDGRFTIAPQRRALLAVELDQGRLDLSAQAWAVRGMSGRYSAGDTQHLKLAVGEIRSTREPALVAPIRADLDAQITAREASFVAHAHAGAGLVDVTLKGRHERGSGQGEAILSAQPMVFSDASGLGALSPALAARGFKAGGTLTMVGKTHWGGGSPRHALSLALQEFALEGPAFKASAVNGALQVDGLAPLHSGPGQYLNGVLDLPTVKRVPFALRFALDTDKLLIEKARAELFDGAFETTAAEINLKSNAMRMDLRVVDIDLESAFMVLNLEQLQGSGRITGLLPLALQGGHLAVAAGHLEATGPGTVQIGASSVTDQLKSYGPDVDLAFRVLSDFHYQRLRIDADKTLLGAGKAMFHLEGDNPAVMNSQPFVFNISLETDFDYLAKLLLELSGTTNRALGWGAGEILKR